MQAAVTAAYERYEFHEVVKRVQNFCSNEMGALYLDITKDRLYTMPTNSHGRRSAQSAMYRIVEAMARWLAPILSFTAEEIWQAMPAPVGAKRPDSPLFATWYDGLAPLPAGAALDNDGFERLLQLRSAVARLLEGMRNEGQVGSSLQARVSIGLPAERLAAWRELADELRFFFITSTLELVEADQLDPADEVRLEDGSTVRIRAVASSDDKCVRCWHYRADVGSHADHPQLCGRCVGNVAAVVSGEGGGEQRRYF